MYAIIETGGKQARLSKIAPFTFRAKNSPNHKIRLNCRVFLMLKKFLKLFFYYSLYGAMVL